MWAVADPSRHFLYSAFDLRTTTLFSQRNSSCSLKVRDNEHVHWSGEYRTCLTGQGVYPRPLQNPLPIWIGVGGTPQSFVRAGALGLPLMVAIIGGETRQFRPLIDLYREARRRAGHSPESIEGGGTFTWLCRRDIARGSR